MQFQLVEPVLRDQLLLSTVEVVPGGLHVEPLTRLFCLLDERPGGRPVAVPLDLQPEFGDLRLDPGLSRILPEHLRPPPPQWRVLRHLFPFPLPRIIRTTNTFVNGSESVNMRTT